MNETFRKLEAPIHMVQKTISFSIVGLAIFANAANAQDWPLFGGSIYRNNVRPMVNVHLNFDVERRKNVKWSTVHGNAGNSSPIIGNGKILVSTNNGAGYRPKHAKEDRGVMVCFDENTGKFLWQLTREKLASGRVNDWPVFGMISCACIDGNRAYVVTNRAELMCVDLDGFADGENDGPFKKETDKEVGDADIIWSYDMIGELGVFPHNLSVSSPVVYKDHVFVITGNGVNESHKTLPAPDAPSFLCVNKKSGKAVWHDDSPGKNIKHGSWSSPAIGIINGKAQVCMPGGDGWLYSFDATSKEKKLLWKFDLNPKASVWKLGGEGTRNNVIGTPVFHKNSFVVGTGQDPEHGAGSAYVYRVDATKKGDVSAELGEKGGKVKPNPNSGMIWRYGGIDKDGSLTGEKGQQIFNRTVATAVVQDDLVYIGDIYGYFHCIDFNTGKNRFLYDAIATIYGTALVADGKVFFGTEDGDLIILEHGPVKKEIKKVQLNEAIYTTPTIANRVLYLLVRKHLHAIDISK